MKLHLITIGKPKLQYAKLGWDEYLGRLQRLHDVRVSQLSDKYAGDTTKILDTAGNAYKVALVIGAKDSSSQGLAAFLRKRELESREVAWIIGGPDGLPSEVIANCDLQYGFSRLTFPHDLAMVVLAETLYRASTINAGTPYHH
jgi:23S rRNA (pseudouridine1915-N3)-methyltransferase